ncbi:S8 family serine peptidase [Demequina sp. B12]|uniref:S8 family serine peptidase n=1 Tax=Demequina sp. B12 TaxID=2992757 RepID=UPI00237B18F1|nr:S8 family serine peptidase [Demequina sp. B12]MDE0573919.1 S8 family serine peptidase [Demequina sp. B12]
MRRIIPAALVCSTAVLGLSGCSQEVDPTVATDGLRETQWGLDEIGVPYVWAQGYTGEDVVIAILDTGIDTGHPDLRAHIVDGYDFIDDDRHPKDENGHGTHVAGIAAGEANNKGIIGAAPGAKIMPLRVLDSDGAGTNAHIAEAIDWAVDHGANVINLSLDETGLRGRISKGGIINDAIERAHDNDVIVVAASGNNRETGNQYKFGTHVLVVNATNVLGLPALYSNAGDERAVAAPGSDIVSTVPTYATTLYPDGSDGYETMSGTSMASPLVAGAVALLLSAGVPAQEVPHLLAETAHNDWELTRLDAGIIDVEAALTEAQAQGLTSP